MNRFDVSMYATQRGEWLRQVRQQDGVKPLRELLGDAVLERGEVLELACMDLLACGRVGRAVRVEAYLSDFPDLATDSDCVLDLIDAEICARQEQGDAVAVAEFAKRFPALADPIGRLLEVDGLESSLFAASPVSEAVLHAPQDFSDYCSVDLPDDVRITGLLSVREEVVCLRGTSKGNRAVVVKVVSKRRLSAPDAFERIGDNLERLSSVTHPSWVTPDVVAESSTQFAMVRPFVAGTLLTNRLIGAAMHDEQQPLGTASPQWKPLLRELADLGYAVAAVHGEQLAHGSLHPNNLYRDHGGALRVVDAGFGFPDGATRWSWRLPSQPRLEAADQERDVAGLARIVDQAMQWFSAGETLKPNQPSQQLAWWCASIWRHSAAGSTAAELADNLLALADGRSLRLPRSQSGSSWKGWLGKKLGASSTT